MTNVYVKDARLYAAMRETFARRIQLGTDFPADVRAVRSDKVRWVRWDDWTRERFFEFATEQCRLLHASWWGVVVTDPDPDTYFHHHFKCYPAILGNELRSSQEYLASIAADPGRSPADAISYNAATVLVGDSTGRWAGYFNRDFELGVLVTHDTELSAYPYDTYADSISAASGLLAEGEQIKSDAGFSRLFYNYDT